MWLAKLTGISVPNLVILIIAIFMLIGLIIYEINERR